MKKVKKLLSCILSLCMLFSVCEFSPLTVSADGTADIIYLNSVANGYGLPCMITGKTPMGLATNPTGARNIYVNGAGKAYTNAIRQDVNTSGSVLSSLIFDLTDAGLTNGGVFHSYIGFQQIDVANFDTSTVDAVFRVYIDGEEIINSGVMHYNTLSELSCRIPSTAKQLTLAVDCYDTDSQNEMTIWGTPIITPITNPVGETVYLNNLSGASTFALPCTIAGNNPMSMVSNASGSRTIWVNGAMQGCNNSIRQDAKNNVGGLPMSSMTFDLLYVDLSYGGTFQSYCGLQYSGNAGIENAKLIFRVYIDGIEVKNSGVIGYGALAELSCEIPSTARTLTLAADCYDADYVNDLAVWGTPKIIPNGAPPTPGDPIFLQDLVIAGSYTRTGNSLADYITYPARICAYSSGNDSYQKSLRHDAGANMSTLKFDLPTDYYYGGYFHAYLGVQNGANTGATVSFHVYIDGKEAATSGPVICGGDKAELFCAFPADAKTIMLATDNCDGEFATDYAVWGTPQLIPYMSENEGISLTSLTVSKITNPLIYNVGTYTLQYVSGKKEYEKSIFSHANPQDNDIACLEYDVSTFTKKEGTLFQSYVGLASEYNGSSNTGGNVNFIIQASTDGTTFTEIARKNAVTMSSDVSSITAALSEGTKNLRLLVDPNGSNSNDWAVWGAPCLLPNAFTIGASLSEDRVDIGGNASVIPSIVYIDGTAESDYTCSYVSRDDTVASVSDDGTVTPHAFGSTEIVCTMTFAGMEKEIVLPITVINAAYDNAIRDFSASSAVRRLALAESTTINTSGTLNSGSAMDPDVAEITYESSDSAILSVNESGTATAIGNGVATVNVTLNYNGTVFTDKVEFFCGEVSSNYESYLSDMSYTSAVVGSGAVYLNRDIDGNNIHFRNAGNEVSYTKGIFAHAASTITYDIENMSAVAFKSYIGINDSLNKNEVGSVIFKVYADDTLIAQSSLILLDSAVAEINADIPEGAKTLRLVVDPNGSNDSDHSAWAEARLIFDGRYTGNVKNFTASPDSDVLNIGETALVHIDGKYVDNQAFDETEDIFTYESSDVSIFTVSEDGVITAVSNGIATLTVTAHGTDNSVPVQVTVLVGHEIDGRVFSVKSPDGSREAVFVLNSDGTLNYSVIQNGKTVIGMSPLGFDTSLADFTSGLDFTEASTATEIDETYTLTAHTQASYRNHGNERKLTFTKNGAKMEVVVRAYDDGIAFRYIITSSDGKSFTVNDETTQMKMPNGTNIWAMPYTSTMEGLYGKYTADTLSGYYSLPFIMSADSDYVMVTDAALNSEYGSTKVYSPKQGFLRFTKTETSAPTVSSPFHSPWKVLITGSLGEIFNSSLVTDVSDAPDQNADYSFVEPGISSWSWMTTKFKGQSDPNIHKKFIDFAADMGWKYYTLDYGWQKPDGEIKDGNFVVQAGVYYDWTEDVINYANEKGVKLIAWVHRDNLVDETKMNAILEDYKRIGIAGIKADFFNSESAQTIALYERLYKKCAELGLVVNCHGANRPTGEVRTYPNVIAREGIRGEEYAPLAGMWISQYTILPFTRGVTGPVDVTEYLYPRLNNQSTCGSEMALSVLMTSGLHYLSASPEDMEASPAKELYRNFPAVWDESKYLDGDIGSYVLVARRSGTNWYAAGVTSEARNASFNLSFLGEGRYLAEIYKDSASMSKLAIDTKVVTKSDSLTLAMLQNGGAVVKLTSLEGAVGPESISFEKPSVTLGIGEKAAPSAIILGDGITANKLIYTSSNDEVATVTGGTVTAIGAGITVIRACSAVDDSVYAEYTVNVRRDIGAFPPISITVPSNVVPGTSVSVSFTAADLENFRLVGADFETIDYTLNSKTNNGEAYLYTISFTANSGGVYAILSATGKEITFFILRSLITVTFDGVNPAEYLTGSTITLPSESDSGNNVFLGWRYGGKVYANTFTLSSRAENVNFESSFADKAVSMTIYLDAENGDDANSGYAFDVQVKTLARAVGILNNFPCTEKIVKISGTLNADQYLPVNESMIVLDGGGAGTFVINPKGTVMKGALTFRNIRLINNTANKFLDTYGNTLILDAGTITDDSPVAIIIHSGTMNANGGRENVTVNSGTVIIWAGSFYNVSNVGTTAGANYTVNGGNVNLIFKADFFATTQYGMTFTDTVNIIHNSGTLAVSVVSNDSRPITFEKAVSVISNNSVTTSLSNLADYALNGYYRILSEQSDGCYCLPSDIPGTFTAVKTNGMNAFLGRTYIDGAFSVADGDVASVEYRPAGEAMIGQTVYSLLGDALNAAQNGETVTLNNNITLSEDLTLGNLVLDTDGFAVSGGRLFLTADAKVISPQAIADVLLADGGHFIAENVAYGIHTYIHTAGFADGNDLFLEGDASINGSENALVVSFVKDSIVYVFSFTTNGTSSVYGTDYEAETVTVTVNGGSIDRLFPSKNASISSFAVIVKGGSISTLYAGSFCDSGTYRVGNAVLSLEGGTIGTVYATGLGTSQNGTVTINACGSTFGNIFKISSDSATVDQVTVNASNGNFFTGWNENKALFHSLTMYGIQMRTAGIQGLRFIAELDGDLNAGIASYGMVVLPSDILGDAELTLETPRIAKISSLDAGFNYFSKGSDYVRYTVCLINIPPKYYDRKFSVRAYAKYELDGNEKIVYSDPYNIDVLTTVKGLNKQYPGEYEELYQKIMSDYSATFVSAGELKEKVKEYTLSGAELLDLENTKDDVILTADKTSNTVSGWKSTDYMDVGDYSKIQYALAVNRNLYSVAFFDENKAFISGVTTTSTNSTYAISIYDAAIPSNARYVRFANFVGTSSDSAFEFAHASICKDIGSQLTTYMNAKDSTNLSSKKIVCVGDSLTYGDYGTTVPGQGYPHPENYPYFLNQYLGASVEWYAWGGYTATKLAADYSDGVFSGKLNKHVSITDADYILVMLGTNEGLTLNGNTHYDSYCSLIEAMKQDIKSGAKIILCTPPHATTDSSKVNCGYMPNITNSYPEVYKLAEKYNLTVFDVYRDSGLDADVENIMQPNDGLHFGSVGYATLASFFANELKLLSNGRLDAMNLSEEVKAADNAFLATINYPSYELCNSGTYNTLGRWFKKEINGVINDVTVTDGAELYFLTNGASSFTVDFTVITEKATPYFAVSIDGGEPERHLITDNTVMLPDTARHAVRLIMDGLTETEAKWSGEIGFAIKNININSGTIKAIRPTNEVIFYYGDSITEGINALGTTANSPVNSATHSYAYYSARELGAIPYIIGYGATGILSKGSFNTMLNAIDYLSESRTVDDSVTPDKIVINHGHNDASQSSENFCAALRTTIDRLCEKYPDTPIYYVIPFAQYHADDIRTVAKEYDNVKVVESDDFDLTYSDGIHPDAAGAEKAGHLIAEVISRYGLATENYAKYMYYRKSLQNTYTKLTNDKDLTIAYFGGSVTAGYGASDFNTGGTGTDTKSWRAQTTQWFRNTYPDADINEIYAAIGESGTFLGTYIVQDYIIAKQPDLVFLEYAINDNYGGFTKEQAALQCETIVREIKEALPKADIVILITIDQNTSQNYSWFYPTAEGHAMIAEAYNIPLVFMGRALTDHITETGAAWNDYIKDIVHPLDAGYAYYFDVVKEYLNNSLIAEMLKPEYLADDVLPDLVSDHLMDGDRTLVYATSDILTDENSEWTYYANKNINPVFSTKGSIGALIADEPTFTYTFTGTEFSVYTNLYSPATFTLTVDGVDKGNVTFSGHNPTTVVKDLDPGTHTVKIRLNASSVSDGTATMYIDAVMFRDASKQTIKSSE